MSEVVTKRREAILELLRTAVPEGLTREQIAAELLVAGFGDVSVPKVKSDLIKLSHEGLTVCRSGGRDPGTSNGYIRCWHIATNQSVAKGPMPCYDTLKLALMAGASIPLTLDLLEKLHEEFLS